MDQTNFVIAEVFYPSSWHATSLFTIQESCYHSVHFIYLKIEKNSSNLLSLACCGKISTKIIIMVLYISYYLKEFKCFDYKRTRPLSSIRIVKLEIINPLTSYDNTPWTKGKANQVETNPPHTGVVVFSNNAEAYT